MISVPGAPFPQARLQLIFAASRCKNGFSTRAVPAGVSRLPLQSTSIISYGKRHIWVHYVEGANHLHHLNYIKQIYMRHKKMIERVFADANEQHGMRWTTLHGIKKLSMQVILTFCCYEFKEAHQLDLASSRNGINNNTRGMFLSKISRYNTQKSRKTAKGFQNDAILKAFDRQSKSHSCRVRFFMFRKIVTNLFESKKLRN